MGVVFTVGLVACSNSNSNSNSNGNDSIDVDYKQTDLVEENEVPTDEDVVDEPEELIDFEEAQILAEHIDIDGLKVEVETDNPITRVILFKEGEHETKYQSVFVKKEKRLKIIDLNDDGMIYSEAI